MPASAAARKIGSDTLGLPSPSISPPAPPLAEPLPEPALAETVALPDGNPPVLQGSPVMVGEAVAFVMVGEGVVDVGRDVAVSECNVAVMPEGDPVVVVVVVVTVVLVDVEVVVVLPGHGAVLVAVAVEVVVVVVGLVLVDWPRPAGANASITQTKSAPAESMTARVGGSGVLFIMFPLRPPFHATLDMSSKLLVAGVRSMTRPRCANSGNVPQLKPLSTPGLGPRGNRSFAAPRAAR